MRIAGGGGGSCSACALSLVLVGGCYSGVQGSGAGASAGEDDAGEDGDGSGDDGSGDDGSGDDGASEDCLGDGAGYAPMRRLTKAQYDNTVRDLFGGVIEPGPQFPESVIHDDYTNNPAANIISLVTAQDVMEAAEAAGEQVVDDIDAVVSCNPGPECAAQFIDDFGRRALRRPLEPSERDALLAVYDMGSAEEGFADGIGTVVTTVLQMPQFLYLFEAGAEEVEPGVVALSDHELASRLSYLLWDSTPDATLLDLADAGELSDPDVLSEQAARLLADHGRSGPAVARFFREWMQFDGVPAYDKDESAFPSYDDVLAAAMDEELSRFVDGVMASDTPTLEAMLTSNVTQVDATMAAFYGVTAPASGWEEVTLPEEARGGLLTRPALLAEHSTATSTAPIFRGRLVRTQFLCNVLPPPPPDAMANAPEYPEDATERERTEILINHMSCGACHSLMNPIGLGFEHYDPIGAWRDLDIDGGPVDATGEIIGSTEALTGTFDGVDELSGLLASSDDVSACFSQHLYRYTLGLEPKEVLQCAIDPVQTAFIDSGGDIPTLVDALVKSNAFRMRVVEEQ